MARRTLIWLALLVSVVCVEALQAQNANNRDILPLRFARAGKRARRKLREDWEDLAGEGLEWAYCITQWSIVLTADKDTVYEVDELVLVRRPTDKHVVNDVRSLGCERDGQSLPIAHSHPSGDCSPSRDDITMAVVRRAPFELIVCGPESTLGYNGQLYHEVIVANVERSSTQPKQ